MNLVSALLIGSFASAATATSEPSARLVRCGAESCLRISGHRDNPASIVTVNGHVAPAEGRRRWKVDLPIGTVRDWSAPYARAIEVSLHDPETQRQARANIALPIGLLGGATHLASLVVVAP